MNKDNVFTQYEHHGTLVWVNKFLKGRHREHCLCYNCENFKPNQDDNCEIAEENYALCKKHSLTLPVYECPKFSRGLPDFSGLDAE